MGDFIGGVLSLAFAAQALRVSMPYLFAALGGVVSERSGVIDLSLEGKLLLGALAAEIATHATGSPTLGVVAGVAGGVLAAAIYGVAVIRFRADQVVSGVAVNILALGLSAYLIQLLYGSASNAPTIPGLPVALWQNALVYLAVLLVVVVHLGLHRTAIGLRVRAAGEHPDAAVSLGVSVVRTRWIAVLTSGGLAGVGGAWLALENHGFVAAMSSGRGYVALAAVIMGKWRPVPAALACLFFGVAEAVQIQLKTSGVDVPDALVSQLPYVLTIIALAGFIGRSRAPAALGRPHGEEG